MRLGGIHQLRHNLDRAVRRGTHKSVQALEADIRAWIADQNSNPRPFTWTETAEEILEPLARFL